MQIMLPNFNFALTPIVTLILLTSAKHISSSVSPHYVQFECPRSDFSYSLGSTFEADLKHTLLDVLPSNAGSSNFVHMGQDIDEIYALYYCTGDVTAQDCHDCVQAAAWTVLQHCSPLKEGIVWYEECTLYYSNRSDIFSPDEGEEGVPQYRNYNSTMSSVLMSLDEYQYQEVFNSTMDGLISQAAFGTGIGISQGFATSETKLDLSQSQPESQSSLTLRGLVQCSPHIVGGPCERCLRSAAKQMDGWATTMVFLPSCSLRFDLLPSQIEDIAPSSPGKSSCHVCSIQTDC